MSILPSWRCPPKHVYLHVQHIRKASVPFASVMMSRLTPNTRLEAPAEVPTRPLRRLSHPLRSIGRRAS
ncbi:hypothetical protein E2C01_057204 [Portunus trituberculatus]|uniref:Uncharacterized protein n=1 Tax=Portunus trituberculatus TaxID=210409 RepID=A0A5B7GST1_PORTR|nr:hypothetical protein [Portunus trituberculatus]